MAYKLFDRRWALTVDDGLTSRTWDRLELDFKIVKTGDTQPNDAEITVYNLNADSRDFINRRNLAVTLVAGYAGSSGQIFKGNSELINHAHEGVDWASKIYAKDGGAALRDLVFFKTFAKDTPLKTVIEAVLKKITSIPEGLEAQFQEINRLAQGAIDLQSFKPKKPKPKDRKRTKRQKDVPPEEQQRATYLEKKEAQREKAELQSTKRALTLRGAAIDKLRALCRMAGLECIITDCTVHIFPAGLALDNQTIILDRSSGLIGSPELTEATTGKGTYKFRSLLRHEFNPGLIVEVQSRYVTGPYLIERVEHHGSSRGGDWFTELYCVEFDE